MKKFDVEITETLQRKVSVEAASQEDAEQMCIRDSYFGLETLKLIVRSPLVLLGLEGKYDVVVRVSGGGVSGQAGAIRHGLSRALLQQSDENRSVLKKAGFLTRDPRMKERKKYGLKAARRAPQFSKR